MVNQPQVDQHESGRTRPTAHPRVCARSQSGPGGWQEPALYGHVTELTKSCAVGPDEAVDRKWSTHSRRSAAITEAKNKQGREARRSLPSLFSSLHGLKPHTIARVRGTSDSVTC